MASTLLILLYHGVSNSSSIGIENNSKKHISLDLYYNQMVFLKENANLVTMDDVIDYYKKNKPFPKNSVAITFDDGFENNYTNCLPIIDELEIPTTFYISSGLIGTKNMFWVDILEDCLNMSDKKEIEIVINNKQINFDLRHQKNKLRSLKKIKKFCKSTTNETRLDIVSQIIETTEVTPSPDHAENYKILNWNQLKEMHNNSNVIIGGHSLNHEILSSMEKDKMSKNIKESLNLLNINLSTVTNHYSYPEGQDEHYNHKVINVLEEHGIQCSPSARYGLNYPDNDLFNLYRVMVGFDMIPFPYEMIKNGGNLPAVSGEKNG